VNIYLACTVRGDRCALDATRAIASTLTALGHTILTSHLLADGIEDAESKLTEREVFDRDLDWLRRADVLIAEASGSSFGVGFEVGYFLASGNGSTRRALVLYDAGRRERVSRLVVGNSHPGCTTCAYRDAADVGRLVADFVQRP
jgi:hypothetical protein